MTFLSDTSVPDAVLRVLQNRAVVRFSDIIEELLRVYGKAPPDQSLRVSLGRMVNQGKLVRPAQGEYCLPGREPPPIDITDWTARKVVQHWPNAYDAQTLRKLFKAEHRRSIPWESFDRELVALEAAGRATKTVPGAYAWWRRPTVEDYKAPLPEPSIFA